MSVCFAKPDEPIEVTFGVLSRVLGGIQDPRPTERGNFSWVIRDSEQYTLLH